MEDIILVDMTGVTDEAAIQAKIDECTAEYQKNPVSREPIGHGDACCRLIYMEEVRSHHGSGDDENG